MQSWPRSLPNVVIALLLMPSTGALAEPGTAGRPIPDVKMLLRNAAARQQQIDDLREDYEYTETAEIKDFDGSGRVKESKTEESAVLFVNGEEIRRLVKRNGVPLNAGDAKKEQDRVTKDIEKAQKTAPVDHRQRDSMSISRLIENVRLATPHRELYNRRSTIVADFASNPGATTHGAAEDVAKRLSGTLWIDESDGTIARLYARLDTDFHVGGGLFATVHKGSTLDSTRRS